MKIQRHILIPFLLTLYASFMVIYFGIDLLRSGQTVRFIITLVAEITVITLCFFFLRKRDRIRNSKRNSED